jgi:hypothetical protein
MATASDRARSWLSATVDVLLAVFGFVLVWYPAISIGNAVLTEPVSNSTVSLLVGVLALGSAYPVVAGEWSLGAVGEFVFVLIAAAFGWGLVGMLLLLGSGQSLSGATRLPQALVWAAGYLTAYVVVYKIQITVFR